MPREAPNRWEGTHTYKKPEAEKKRARTVAQLREEAAAKSKASREEAINKRRGSICGPAGAPSGRRGSTGGISTPTCGSAEGGAVGEVGSMPGSSKKGRQNSGTGSEEDSGGINPALKEFLTAMKEDIVQSNRETLGRIEERLDKNERNIAGLERRVVEAENSIATKISAEVSRQCAPALAAIAASKDKAPQPSPSSKSTGKRDEAYQRARRSLKIWPIEGENLEDSVRVFFKNRLGVADDRIHMMGSISVWSQPSRLAKERKEILATFENREDRDFIKAQGTNLAGQKEAGMSIQVPGHLLDNLAALNGLAYSIKQRIPGLRRAVKFDDAVQDLVLDVCIAGNWRRVTPTQAKAALKSVPSASGGESGTLDASVLSDLIQGKEVPGLTVTIVPEEEMED